MSDSTLPKISIIASPKSMVVTEELDRGGAEEQGLAQIARQFFSSQNINAGDLGTRLHEQMKAIGVALDAGLASAIRDFRLSEVTVSLAVTAEGHIGIASVGVEGSIDLKFEHRDVASTAVPSPTRV